MEHFILTVCKSGPVCGNYRHNLAQFVGLARSVGLAQFVGLICITVGDDTNVDSCLTL